MARTETEPPATVPGTRDRIVDAALSTLKREGYSRTSARTIARTGDFNQALIFYHFGGVNELLLAAVDRVSTERMARYRAALDPVTDIAEFVTVAERLYREDLDSGHTTVLAEMVAASLAEPALGPHIVERMDGWVDYAEELIGRLTKGTPMALLVAPRDLAGAVIAFYLGIEVLTHLDGNRHRADPLFASGKRAAALLQTLVGGAAGAPQ